MQAVAPEPFDLYGEFSRRLANELGRDAWGWILMADTRMRSEMFERIRRSMAHLGPNQAMPPRRHCCLQQRQALGGGLRPLRP